MPRKSTPKVEKKERKRREPLTRDRIASTALALIDAHGLEELSTRQIGRALGCEAMAIYNHFASKDALLDAVVDRIMRKVEMPTAGSGWVERVRGFSRSYRALARIHPHAFPLVAMRRFDTEATKQLLDSLFGALLDEGFEPKVAVQLFRTVGNFTSGTALDEIAGTKYAARHAETAQGTEAQAEEAVPRLAKVGALLSPTHFDAIFEQGLDIILEGFKRLPGAPKP
ncbi:TetR/AcrR family transcriptional regulator [soil metagenome]